MFFYRFHLSDWMQATAHLSLIEEAVYRRLLDYYYETETPLPVDPTPLIRRLRLAGYENEVGQILSEFFTLEDDGYHNARADAEIVGYHDMLESKRRAGAMGGRRPNKKEPSVNPVGAQPPEKPEEVARAANGEEAEPIPEKPQSKGSVNVRAVFEHWVKVMRQPRAVLTDERIRLINAQLRDGYTVEDLCQAISGCSLTPHNMGANDRGQKYNGLNVILRSGDQVDRFIANAVTPPKARNSFDRGIDAAQKAIDDFVNGDFNG